MSPGMFMGPHLVGGGPGGNAAGVQRDRGDEGVAENGRRGDVLATRPARSAAGRSPQRRSSIMSTTPAVPKSSTRSPVPASRAHELEARRHHEDAVVAGPVRPVGHAAPRAPGDGLDDVAPAPLVVAGVPVPDRLAGSGVEGDHAALVADGRVEDAVDHDGADLRPAGRGRRALVARAPAPRHLQVADVAGVDLVERRVAGGARVRPEHAPFAVGGARPGRSRRRSPDTRRPPPPAKRMISRRPESVLYMGAILPSPPSGGERPAALSSMPMARSRRVRGGPWPAGPAGESVLGCAVSGRWQGASGRLAA